MKLGLALPALLAPLAKAARVVTALEATPVSRVVSLLEDIKQRLEKELEAEQDAWQKYDCWHKTVVEAKEASNTAAESRIDSLTTYVNDIESGKFEFTSERQDLEKQVAALIKDLEDAEKLRKEQKADFEAAKEEMEAAITALDDAITTLEDGAPAAAMFATKGASLGLVGIRKNMEKVLMLGKAVLSKSDLAILEKELSSDVPKPDWKKLNREATFKKEYESRTKEIVIMLKKMKTTFAKNLQQAEDEEAEQQATYDKLKESKTALRDSTQDDLVLLTKEHGARELTKTEANAEIDALTAQVDADKDFIKQVDDAHSEKKDEWTERERLRTEELAAVGKAVAVLHSDDARDTFKKSYQSQGFSLLQQAKSAQGSRLRRSSGLLFSLMAKTGDARLLSILGKREAGTIAEVITMVDELITSLEDEESSDLTKKESCEKKRAEVTRQAKVESVAIDDLTDEATRQKQKAKEQQEQIEEQEKVIEELKASLVDIERNREDEKRQYEKDKVDDEAALQLMKDAMKIIEDMLKDTFGKGSLSQKKATVKKQPLEVNAGEAPPPPPSTWDAPEYKGAGMETDGIIGIMTLLKEDIEKDIASADKAEEDAIAEYDKQKDDLEKAEEAAKTAISDLEGVKATAEGDAVTTEEERATKRTDLEATLDELKALAPGCDWLLVNFPVRVKNRNAEIDGLKKAKFILEGAEDPA